MQPRDLARKLDPQILVEERRLLLEQTVRAVERHVKRSTPVKRGTLRRSVAGRVLRAGALGVVGTNLFYARFVHNGTKAHTITPLTRPVRQQRTNKDGKPSRRQPALFWRGAAHPVAKVRHPGSKANPFLTRGMDQAQPDIDRLTQRAGERIAARVAS